MLYTVDAIIIVLMILWDLAFLNNMLSPLDIDLQLFVVEALPPRLDLGDFKKVLSLYCPVKKMAIIDYIDSQCEYLVTLACVYRFLRQPVADIFCT